MTKPAKLPITEIFKHVKHLTISCLCIFSSCSQLTNSEVVGLWKLKESAIDHMSRRPHTLYLKLDPNNTFSVAQQSGDLTGIYEIQGDWITFHSNEHGWFQNKWHLRIPNGDLLISERTNLLQGTRLKFERVGRIPTFEAFEEQVIGSWELYKIRKKGQVENIAHTTFHVDGTQNYQIVKNNEVVEKGRVIIDTRHKKITFENQAILWDAWFYGDELRLSNKEMLIEYDLRRVN